MNLLLNFMLDLQHLNILEHVLKQQRPSVNYVVRFKDLLLRLPKHSSWRRENNKDMIEILSTPPGLRWGSQDCFKIFVAASLSDCTMQWFLPRIQQRLWLKFIVRRQIRPFS
jgi:hypothetical protein